jgi:hypothetical protein
LPIYLYERQKVSLKAITDLLICWQLVFTPLDIQAKRRPTAKQEVGALNVAYYFETINLPFTKGTAFRVSIMPPKGGI